MKKISVDLQPIGIVHAPYKKPHDAPFQGSDEVSTIELYKEFSQGLEDIDGFSHLHIFYWLHQSKGYSLMVQTPWDVTPHGLFTTRSPHRPNPIGHAVAMLIGHKDNVLTVKGLDAIEGTPVIDIKPYVKKIDSKVDAKSGWLSNAMLRLK